MEDFFFIYLNSLKELGGVDVILNSNWKEKTKSGKAFITHNLDWNVCGGNRELRPDLRNYRHCWIEPEIKHFLASVHHLLPTVLLQCLTSAVNFFRQSGDDELSLS